MAIFLLPAAVISYNKDALKIVVVKHEFTLYLYNGAELVKKYQVAVGKNPGDKVNAGDKRTPEGNFYITRIEDSRTWTHDFGDGKGQIKGAYGPWFLRLYTGKDSTKSGKGWIGYGIHGTHDDSSIGTLASEGCIRLHNKDIRELKELVRLRTPVEITP
jgi:lipoprotein-anchoring transpeptidase ErfK/SrfK